MRYLTHRVLERTNRGAAVATVASTAANRLAERTELTLELDGAHAADKWRREHLDVVDAGYIFSKEAVVVWTMDRSADLIKQAFGSTAPAPDLRRRPWPTLRARHRQEYLGGLPRARSAATRGPKSSLPALFLNSAAASYISGHNLMVDGALGGGVATNMSEVQRIVAQRAAST